MTTLFRNLLAVALTATLGSMLSGAPLVSLGDDAAVYFKGSAGITYQTNVFLEDDGATDIFGNTINEDSDTIYRFTPGLELRVGQDDAINQVYVTYSHAFTVYSDNSQLDNDLANLLARFRHNGDKLKLDGNISFVQADQNQRNVQQTGVVGADGVQIESETFTIGGNAEYRFTPKTSGSIGLTYTQTDYNEAALIERESIRVPVDLYYAITEKYDLSVGYRYTQTDRDAAGLDEFDDHFFNVGLRGEILSKLSGQVRVGVQNRETQNEDETNFAINADFDYAASPKLGIAFGLESDFDTAGTGNSRETFGFNIGTKYTISPLWSTSTMFRYRTFDYTASDRQDDYMSTTLGISYSPNAYLSFSAGYTYVENDSDDPAIVGNQPTASYENSSVNFSASLRY